MKIYNISDTPEGLRPMDYDAYLLSGYTDGFQAGYESVPCIKYEDMYFTIEALSGGTITVPAQTKWRLNGGEWNEEDEVENPVEVEPGDKIEMSRVGETAENLFRGTDRWFTGGTMTDYAVYGNIMSLLYGDEFQDQVEVGNSAFLYLFRNSTGITDASNLILPATALTEACYCAMFQECPNLVKGPELPAIVLAKNCYSGMFRWCTNLASAPALPATTLAERCYYMMFQDCVTLTETPELPATTLATNCYGMMFNRCTGITTAPALPATTLAEKCYQLMFDGCTSLTSAPVLPATTLAPTCYNSMFSGCTSLNYIKCLATDISATDCTRDWVKGVASTGMFMKPANTVWGTGVNGIPDNWTVVDA